MDQFPMNIKPKNNYICGYVFPSSYSDTKLRLFIIFCAHADIFGTFISLKHRILSIKKFYGKDSIHNSKYLREYAESNIIINISILLEMNL